MKKIEIKFLNSFFKLFKAKVTINEINNDNVFYGVVKWDDGETPLRRCLRHRRHYLHAKH